MMLERRVKDIILEYNMISPGELILVGVSGGPDSIALLHLLLGLKEGLDFDIHVAHLNHSFRGKEADDEALWVKEKSEEWGIPCSVKKEDVLALAKKHGLSNQDAGHIARMTFFQDLSKKLKANKIALAHHGDDQAETVLVNLVSGAGLEGLRGMLPVNDMIIRPLLFVYRSEIENYCSENNLTPRRDPSNKKNIYLRNKMRNQLIPWIRENINPNIVQSLNRTARILAAEEELLEQEILVLYNKYVIKDNNELSIDIQNWIDIPLAFKRRLIRAVYKNITNQQGPTFHHVEEVRMLAEKKTVGKIIQLPDKVIVEKGYNVLKFYIYGKQKQAVKIVERALLIPGETHIPEKGFTITTEIIRKKPQSKEKDILYLPLKTSDYPKLSVRNRRAGDRFSPIGISGSKKLKDFLIDKKIPKKERDELIVIAEGNKVIWILNIAFGNQVNVEEEMNKYIMIKVSLLE